MAKALAGLIGIGNAVFAAIGIQTGSLAILAGTGAATLALASTALSALTPKQTLKTEGAKLRESRITSASEGEAYGRLYNTYRIGGNIIWSTRLKETVRTRTSGGDKKTPEVRSTTYNYSASFAIGLCLGEVDTLDKLYLDNIEVDLTPTEEEVTNGSPLLNKGGETESGINFTFYRGTQDQEPDPTIELTEGLGNVPAYKGLCYIVFSDLDLTDYGNRIPAVSCEITRGAYTVGGVVSEICQEAGLSLSDIDTTDIDALPMGGYFINDNPSYREMIENLLRVYKVDSVDTGTQIKFFRKKSGGEHTLSFDNLIATEENPFGYSLTRLQAEDFVTQVSFSYADSGKNYSLATVSTEKLGDFGTKLENSSSLSLKESDARNSATIDLSESQFGKETIEFQTTQDFLDISPGDFVTLDGRVYRITGVEESNTLSFAGILSDKKLFENFTFSESVGLSEIDKTPTRTTLYNLDLPILPGETESAYQHRAAVYQRPWFGFVDFYTPDGSGGYIPATSAPFPSILGETTSDLGRGVVDVFDYKNVLNIRFNNPADNVFTISEESLLNGGNAAALQTPSGEWEILQFQNATLNPDGTYTLSKLLRGQLGTEYYQGEPTPSGSKFVLLTPERFTPFPTTLSQIGVEQTFRYGPYRFEITNDDLYTDITFTPKATAFRTYAPVHLKETYSSGDIQLSWVRRDRLNSDNWEQVEIPLSESIELYEVDIYNGSNIVRTLSTTTPQVTYTQAQQISDFGSAQTSLTWRVYQMSSNYGRGTPAIG